MDRGVIFTKGLTVIQKNPRLDSFGLYFGEQFTRAGVSGVMTDRYAFGEFTVLRDLPGGRPKRLLVKEVRKGIGNFARRYVKEITEGELLQVVQGEAFEIEVFPDLPAVTDLPVYRAV